MVYVDDSFFFRAASSDATDPNNDALPLLFVVLGRNQVAIDRQFLGTVFAPNARVSVSGGPHKGAFFGYEVELQPDASLVHRAFPWSTILPPEIRVWEDAAVNLDAWKDYKTGEVSTPEQELAENVGFEIPTDIHVRTGNAGNGLVEFKFRENGNVVTCNYQGRATLAHPETDMERMRGRRYGFVSCSNGYQDGDHVEADWFSLKVLSGDQDGLSPRIGVSLHLGNKVDDKQHSSCSDYIPPALQPEEVVAMRENFSWSVASNLPEIDPDGNPALWHGTIYVERMEQLAALDRLNVFWSTQPLNETYRTQLKGKCGRVEHATDGRGTAIFAVFPAKFYNYMRSFGIQAEAAGIDAPFRFIIPSSPDQPEFVNTDGSIKYSALASSGFLQWVQSRPAVQPGWFDDAAAWVSQAADDTWNWVSGNIVEPGLGAIQTGVNYSTSGFDVAIDWVADAMDDTWEEIQIGLGNFVTLFEEELDVRLHIRVMNRDAAYTNFETYLRRHWGPGCDRVGDPKGTQEVCGSRDASSFQDRPLVAPSGAYLRIRQWGWGFLPVMNEKRIGEHGFTKLKAIKGQNGRGGDVCVELDADYGMITTDFIPNEVCDFAEYGFTRDLNEELQLDQKDIFSFSQMKDSSDYARDVIGHEPHKMDVLSGWVANTMTSAINGGSERAMCLCLDFPSMGKSAVTTVGAGLGSSLTAAGGPVSVAFGLFSASLVEKDLWWPDSNSYAGRLDSRGVMTHEYGHFNMCSMLFEEGGSTAMTGLIARMFEGQNDSRDDEIALMTEGIADTFAMQVVGGSNYVNFLNSVNPSGGMNWCVTPPCMDYNYIGQSDHDPFDPFEDELARYEALFHDAFDTSSSARRSLLQPSNGDFMQVGISGFLTFHPTGYLGADDEPGELEGKGWRDWFKHWLERGTTPNQTNVVGGLVDTLKETQNWCDACEVIATHDASTPAADRPGIPTGITRTNRMRFNRWEACVQSSEMTSLLGAPPGDSLALDTSCNACPVGERADPASGGCVPCPASHIPSGDQCVACATGSIAVGNECFSCEDNEIVVGNACVACSTGDTANRGTNTCDACHADVSVDWNDVPVSCNEAVDLEIVSQAVNDNCPDEFWAEVAGTDEALSRGSSGFHFSLDPLADFTWTNNDLIDRLFCQIGVSSMNIFSAGNLVTSVLKTGVWNGCEDICIDPCDGSSTATVDSSHFVNGNPLRVKVGSTFNGSLARLTVSNAVHYSSCDPR